MNNLHLVNIETLQSQLKQETSDQKRLPILQKLVKRLYPSELSAAQQYAEEGLRIALQVKDKKATANLSNMIAQVYRIHGNFKASLNHLQQALHIQKELKDKINIANIYNSIGVIHENQDNYAEALRFYAKSLNTFEQLKNEMGQANVRNNIGIVQFKRGNYIAALENYYAALQVYESLKVESQLASTYNNIGVIYKRQGDITRARCYYDKCLHIRKRLGDKSGIALSFMNIGNLLKEQGTYEEALEYHQNSLQLRSNINDRETGFSHLSIASTFLKLKQLNESAKHYLEAWQLSQEVKIGSMEVQALEGLVRIYFMHEHPMQIEAMIVAGMGEQYKGIEALLHHALQTAEKIEHTNAISTVCEALGTLYQQKDDFEQAFFYLKKHIEFNKKLLDAQKLDAINQLQNKHELDQREKLQKINSELEETVRIRTEQLTYQNLQLKEYARIVAHDLKEPVRNISTFSNLLEQRFSDILDEEGKEYLHFILFNTRHIDQLLKDLMTYTVLSNNEIADCAPISLNDILSNLQQILFSRIQETGTHLDISSLPSIKAQATHINQLFQNLLQNAIKFRRKDVPCVIKVNAVEQATHYLFSIKDNGIGIPLSFQKEVFRIFNRLDKKRFEGTGIGLAICQKIISMYGGEIWLESQEGVGTTFFFTLPK